MHALGFLGSITALLGGGKLVTLGARRFDPVETWETVERERVEQLYIVGDAFARPLLEALDREPGRFRLDSLKLVRSSGVMWSEPVKRGLLRHHPDMILRDGLGSTESVGMGRSESTGEKTSTTATFLPGPFTRVLTADLQPVVPGSGEVGIIAVGGPNPVGYYKDPQKTAETFRVIDGMRYSLAGDFATVEADGSIRLLGRGSVCINTGGEKVFPEEVEEALKLHPAVRDAVCVGVPDERLGERIVAVVELSPPPEGAPASGMLEAERSAELVAHVKARLAHYKAPRQVLAIASIGRAANGKVDYQRLRAWAREQLLEEIPR
jgi:acyl-CoA synthetase (AMP-forming)/AMP-acid ligase II